MMLTSGKTPHRTIAAVSCLASFIVCLGVARAEAQTAHAYVANTNVGVVDVINPARPDAPSLTVGSMPTQVIANATRAYVVNTGSPFLSVINVATDELDADIPLPDLPASAALSPSGDVIYVLSAAGVLNAFDTGTRQRVGDPFVVGDGGGQIAITRDGKRLYVAAGNVSVIDISTRAFKFVGAPFAPETAPAADVYNLAAGVAVSPNGRSVYVSFTSYIYDFDGFRASGGIAVVDNDAVGTNGAVVTHVIPLFSLPGEIALPREGHLAYAAIDYFWVDTGYGAGFFPGRSVVTIDTSTFSAVGSADLGADAAVWSSQNTAGGLAVTPDRSSVYVTIPRTNSVVAINAADNTVTFLRAASGAPTGIAIVPDPLASTTTYAIDAVDDSPAGAFAASTTVPAIANVLANDTVGGAPAAIENAKLIAPAPAGDGVELRADGSVWVNADAAVGVHSLRYKLCGLGAADCDTPAAADEANVTLTVRGQMQLEAVDDSGTAFAGSIAIPNVLANDRFNDSEAGPETVSLWPGARDGNLSLDLASGAVSVATGAAVGKYSLSYKICEIATGTDNCKTASASVAVVGHEVHAAGDAGRAPRTGGVAVANVLLNDAFDGLRPTLSRVTFTDVSSRQPGVALNEATGSVSVAPGTPAGNASLDYRICESASPGNCSELVTVSVTVDPYVVNAADDQGRGSSKSAGTAIASVLTNDTVGGQPAKGRVQLSKVSLTPANDKIALDTADGAVRTLGKSNSGLYSLVYKICEIGSVPENCKTATARIDLSGK